MKPWIKLYREERGPFAQLPLMTRAIAAEILKLTDDDGVIQLGGRDPAGAVFFALGAERNERRAIRRHIGLLIEDGYLSHDADEDVMRVTNFDRFQSKPKKRKKKPRETPLGFHGDSIGIPLKLHGDSMGIPNEAKPAESLNSAPGEVDKEVEEEEEVEVKSVLTDTPASPAKPDEPTVGEQIRELESAYPADLVADAREAVGLCRRNGKVADSVWLKTLERLAKLPSDASTRAMQTYVARYADGERDERYLVGIARREAKGRRGPVQMPLSAAAHGLTPVSPAHEHERDAARPLPDWMLSPRETANA